MFKPFFYVSVYTKKKRYDIAVYTSDYKEDDKILNVRDSRAEQVFKFNIEMPKDSQRKEGEMVPLIIRMFLGQTEVKVDTIFEGKTTRHTFCFDVANAQKREELDLIHKKLNPTVMQEVKRQERTVKPQ